MSGVYGEKRGCIYMPTADVYMVRNTELKENG
jgi:hypothetical protein